MAKVCIDCGLVELNHFNAKRCKPCAKAREMAMNRANGKRWAEQNKEKVLAKAKLYREQNKEKAREYFKLWREQNKEKARANDAKLCIDCGLVELNHGNAKRCKQCAKARELARGKRRYEQNKEKVRAQNKLWYEQNKEKARDRFKLWYEQNKEKEREKTKLWRKQNKEKVRETAKRYREQNNEKRRANTKLWRKQNKEKVLAYSKIWYEQNTEKCREASRLWREKNPEKAQAALKLWHEQNPEKALAYAHRRRASIYANDDGTVTPEVIKQILSADQCIYCERSGLPLTIDHFEPLARGGKHTVSNLVPACGSCNSSKGKKDVETWMLSRAK